MEEELLTTPEEETEDTVEITDGEPKVSETPQQTESLTLAVEDYNMIAVKSIPIGALSGAIFMIIGFAYLGIVHIFKKVLKVNDPIYQNTRKFVWSEDNPYFFKGKAGEGIGGPHIGYDMVWPMSIMMKAFTSKDDAEIKTCIKMLMDTDAGT